MNDPERPLLANVKEQIGSLEADMRQMASLRWKLARMELRAAIGPIKWLAIKLLIAAVTTLTALPLLAVAVASWLGGRTAISFEGWLLIFGLGLLIGGAAGGYLAWRHFRRRFAGLEQTLEELREDVIWLRDWAGRAEEEDA